jgi:acetyl esterase/lipase
MSKARLTATVLSLVVLACAAVPARGAGRAAAPPAGAKSEPLWPADTPDLRNVKEKDKPTLTAFVPPKEKATGTAVVICPGGGYGFLAIDYEGWEVARWLNSLGVAGFVLKYRHRGNGFGHPAPLRDAQRAIAIVRSGAAAGRWPVAPDRIGIMGFSAGGHLASTAGTHFHKGRPDAADPLDRVSCRPDFLILVYPVISLAETFTHRGSVHNLLGKQPDEKLVEGLSNERQVTAETPPTFLVHADQDRVVPAENSIYFFLALRKAKVPAEMHIYERGRHGFGLGGRRAPAGTKTWPDRCADWMRARKLLEKKPPN